MPTGALIVTATDLPTNMPTGARTKISTGAPTEMPTEVPTKTPTGAHTQTSTGAPNKTLNGTLSETPTEVPTNTSTRAPTQNPASAPANTSGDLVCASFFKLKPSLITRNTLDGDVHLSIAITLINQEYEWYTIYLVVVAVMNYLSTHDAETVVVPGTTSKFSRQRNQYNRKRRSMAKRTVERKPVVKRERKKTKDAKAKTEKTQNKSNTNTWPTLVEEISRVGVLLGCWVGVVVGGWVGVLETWPALRGFLYLFAILGSWIIGIFVDFCLLFYPFVHVYLYNNYIMFPLCWDFFIGHFIYRFFKPATEWPWMRKIFSKGFKNNPYFRTQHTVLEEEIKPNSKTLIAAHQHGILCCGMITTLVCSDKLDSSEISFLVSDVLFYFPIVSDLLLW
jgi:hypothetical protein